MRIKLLDFSFLERLVEKLSGFLKKEHGHLIETVVLPEAKNYAAKLMPSMEDDSAEPFFDTIRGAYTALKRQIAVQMQGSIQKQLGAVNVATANKNIEATQQAIHNVQQKIENKEVDRSRIYVGCELASYQKQRWFINLLAVGECTWFISAFLFIGDIMIIGILLGTAMALAQVIAVKTSVQVIKEVNDRVRRRLYFILTGIAFLLLSLIMSGLRYWFVHVTNGAIPFLVLNPFIFVAINILFVAATGLLVFFYYPSRDDLKKIKQIETLAKEICTLEKASKALYQEMERLAKERELLIELRIRRIHAERKLFQTVDEFYRQAIGVFKNENTSKRSDCIFPPSFKKPHQPLPDVDDDDLLVTETRA